MLVRMRFFFCCAVVLALSACAVPDQGAGSMAGSPMENSGGSAVSFRHYAIDFVDFRGDELAEVSFRLEQLPGYRSLRIAESTGATLRIWYETTLPAPVLRSFISRIMTSMGRNVNIHMEGADHIRVETLY